MFREIKQSVQSSKLGRVNQNVAKCNSNKNASLSQHWSERSVHEFDFQEKSSTESSAREETADRRPAVDTEPHPRQAKTTEQDRRRGVNKNKLQEDEFQQSRQVVFRTRR